MLKRLAVLAVLALSACFPPPEAGDDCNQEGSAYCDTPGSALFCESGSFRQVQCRGPSGCNQGSTGVTCDLTRAQAGDACPAASANQAQCDESTPNRALVCTSGTWTSRTCNACAVQNGQVVCTQ